MCNKVFKLEIFVDDKNEKRVEITVEGSAEDVANMFDVAVGCHKDLIAPILAGMHHHMSVSTAIRLLDLIIKKNPSYAGKEVEEYKKLYENSESAANGADAERFVQEV